MEEVPEGGGKLTLEEEEEEEEERLCYLADEGKGERRLP